MNSKENTNVEVYTLREIADWQLKSNQNVDLPAIQRDFVWNARQIELVWDSLLRGYPIGAFLCSRSDDKLLLLDGQQRATSIARGYFDPWLEPTSNFYSRKALPVVYIDLATPSDWVRNQGRKFIVRVCTQSHPWGYQLNRQSEPLPVSKRKEALELIKERMGMEYNEDFTYTKIDNTEYFPFDANIPVPLSFVLNSNYSASPLEWIEEIKELCIKSRIYRDTKNHNAAQFISNIESLKTDISWLKELHRSISKLDSLRIPVNLIDSDIIKYDDSKDGDDPTLFVRLNTEGTRLSNEELIYSVYKAHYPACKELVESIGNEFLPPSRVVNLVARLAMSNITKSYTGQISLETFKSKIADPAFRGHLEDIVGTKEYSKAVNSFANSLMILNGDDKINFPTYLVKKLANDNPDFLLLLLQWCLTYFDGLSIEVLGIDPALFSKRVLAIGTIISWFKHDSSDKRLQRLWSQGSIDFNTDIWTQRLISSEPIKDTALPYFPVIEPKSTLDFLIEKVVKNDTEWGELHVDTKDIENPIAAYIKPFIGMLVNEDTTQNIYKYVWAEFRNRLIWNDNLLVFFQSKYIKKSFPDYNQYLVLEDQSRPWDIDHIYPYSWIFRIPDLEPRVRHWGNTIGNKRLISLSENRGDGNRELPHMKFADPNKTRLLYNIEYNPEHWQKIDSTRLFDNSESAVFFMNAVVHHIYHIYNHWWTTLNIGEFFNPENLHEPETVVS